MTTEREIYDMIDKTIVNDTSANASRILKHMRDNAPAYWRRYRRLLKAYQQELAQQIAEQRQTNIPFE